MVRGRLKMAEQVIERPGHCEDLKESIRYRRRVKSELENILIGTSSF